MSNNVPLGVPINHTRIQPTRKRLLDVDGPDPLITKNENDHLVTNEADQKTALEIGIETVTVIEAVIVVGEAKDMSVIATVTSGHEAEANVMWATGARAKGGHEVIGVQRIVHFQGGRLIFGMILAQGVDHTDLPGDFLGPNTVDHHLQGERMLDLMDLLLQAFEAHQVLVLPVATITMTLGIAQETQVLGVTEDTEGSIEPFKPFRIIQPLSYVRLVMMAPKPK